ncbi:MAG: hypothetical protein ACJ73D_12665 [Pyrinomonadaceae bacterium]
MGKNTFLVLLWLLFFAACIAGFVSLGKAWATGEIKRSNRSGLGVWKVYRRDEDPTAFGLYFAGLAIINVFFFVTLLGFAIFVLLKT